MGKADGCAAAALLLSGAVVVNVAGAGVALVAHLSAVSIAHASVVLPAPAVTLASTSTGSACASIAVSAVVHAGSATSAPCWWISADKRPRMNTRLRIDSLQGHHIASGGRLQYLVATALLGIAMSACVAITHGDTHRLYCYVCSL